ncbi:hypothetical protein Tco_1203140 [Tanacetum coccineum]
MGRLALHQVDERVFPTVVDWRASAPKDEMPVAGSYSPEDVVVLNTRRTPIQKQPKPLLCLVGLSRRYFLGDDVYPTFLNDDDRDSPRRITECDGTENQGQETVSPEVPPRENVPTVGVTSEIGLEKEVATMGPLVSKKRQTPLLSEYDPTPCHIKASSIPERRLRSLPRERPLRGTQTPRSLPLLHPLQGRPAVAMGSHLRLRFEQEVQLLKRATEKVAKRDQRIQARDEEIKKLDQEIHSLKFADTEVQDLRNQTKNLKALLEAEVDMKKAAEAKNVELAEELESLRAKFSDLQAFADVVSAGLAKGMNEGLQYGIEHGKAGRDLGDVEGYDPEANDKFVKALQDLEDLKYPIWIRDLRPSSSQLKIPIYLEICDPKDPWAVKEEISLEDAIAANINRAEKKKKCRVVCRIHGVGSASPCKSDVFAVSVPDRLLPFRGLAICSRIAATSKTKGFEVSVFPHEVD